MVQRNCELFCQIVPFYAAHAVSDGGSNHWDIFWKGKSFSLHQKLNWRDGRLIISDSDCCLISDGDSNQWDQFLKRQEFFKHKNCFSLHLKLKKKKKIMFSHIITSYSHHILFTYIEVLHPAELRTLCHSSLSNFPSPFLSALANILATWKVKVKLKTVVKVLHESKSLLLQTSWLPATWEQYWKLRQKCIRESESLRSYLQTFWLPVKWKWFRKWMWDIWLPATWKWHWNWMWKWC